MASTDLRRVSITVGSRLLDISAWLAILWTIYEECHYLTRYFSEHGKQIGLIEAIDIIVTLILIGFALYEALHVTIGTKRFDRFLEHHHELDFLLVFLIFSLGWGVYRDISHLQHQYGGSDADLWLFDELDTIAAVILSLGSLKVVYHGLGAIKAFARLFRPRPKRS